MDERSAIGWTEAGRARTARWRAASGTPPPRRTQVAGDEMTAERAFRLACEGTAVLWRGDFPNARQLLAAIDRRLESRRDRRAARRRAPGPPADPAEGFNLYRLRRSQRARILGMLLIPVEAGHAIPLRRAPDVRTACQEAYGPGSGADPYVVSLRDLLGVIGAHEWRRKGVEIPALGGDRIHPHYGVFSPVRGEYVDLVARAPLPSTDLAFDLGTGTGVLAAVLARRGVRRVVATDHDPRALACAAGNAERLGLADRIEIVEADPFPPGRAPLVVCNPPWLPARPSTPLERAVYDPGGRMLSGFLDGLADHLAPGGEGWLVLSDLAEHLGLRAPGAIPAAFDAAGLRVAGRLDARPRHPRAADEDDPLHAARSAETTTLWRLTRGL